jgi:hypothetical protein
MAQIEMRLQIWRPFKGPPVLLSFETGSLVTDGRLGSPVHEWAITTSVFSLASVAVVGELQVLLDGLGIDVGSNDNYAARHSIDRLSDIVDAIDRLELYGALCWADVDEAVATPEGDEVPLRLNGLLALKSHLEWLLETYDGTGDAVVTIG